MRRPLIAGNWKMYKSPTQAKILTQELLQKLAGQDHCDIVLAPPFVSLAVVRDQIRSSAIHLGAQNCYWESEGAFTGEVSAPMLRDLGCEYVILGHSERRQYFGEIDETVAKKLKAAVAADLIPIFCLGESLQEREAGDCEIVVKRQLEKGLASLTPSDISRIIIAYEPVWAIGTGKTATPEMAQEVHGYLRQRLGCLYGESTAQSVRILYGGSVKPDNAADLMKRPDIDGALVGGASLQAESFTAIVSNSNQKVP
jgi:triosephosphate isomerase (TIM)